VMMECHGEKGQTDNVDGWNSDVELEGCERTSRGLDLNVTQGL